MLFLFGYNLKIVVQWKGINLWWWQGEEDLKLGGDECTGQGDFSRWGGESEQIFGWWRETPPPSAPVGKTLMFDYLTKTSIINLKEFTVNTINCIVWESNISIRTQK